MVDIGHLADIALVEAQEARHRRTAPLEAEGGHGDNVLALERQSGGEDAAGQHRALAAAPVDPDFVHGFSSSRLPQLGSGRSPMRRD